MIKTVDNYLSNLNDSDKYYFKFEDEAKRIKNDQLIIGKRIDITLKDYINP